MVKGQMRDFLSNPILLKGESIRSECHGQVKLGYAQRFGKTELVEQYSCSPLLVQKSFYPTPTTCQTVIIHTAGGMVGGDRLSQSITLAEQTQALVTTATAGKIYRTNGLTATQNTQIHVAPQAHLDWMPQENIVFNEALYQQNLHIELAPGGSMGLWDITRFGRSARGEKFTTGEWRSHTEVWQQGKPLWIDRQYLIGDENIITSPHGLAKQPVIGTMVWLGQPISKEFMNCLYQQQQVPDHLGGASRLPQGLICRYRGDSTAQVRAWFMQVWNLLCAEYLQRSNHAPGVWRLG